MFPAEKEGEFEPYKIRRKQDQPAETNGEPKDESQEEKKPAEGDDDVVWEEDRVSEEGAIWPIQQGKIVDWPCFFALITHTYNSLNPPFHTPILLITQPAWTPREHEKLTQFFFEKFKVPAFGLMDAALATTWAYGVHTATVIDVGKDKADITAVSEFIPHTQGRVISLEGCGGEAFTQGLLSKLKSKGLNRDMCEQLKRSPICELLPPGTPLPGPGDAPTKDAPTNPAAVASTGATGPGPTAAASIGNVPRGPGIDTEVGEDTSLEESEGVLDVASIVAGGKMSEYLAKKEKEKAKKEDGVIPGYELENGRHVKRGWTEGKEKKTKTKEQKMLFKTSVPPNAMPLEDEKKSKSKEKKAKKEAEKDGERKNRKTPKVVEEFAKKKHVITSAESNSKAAAEYIEGKGWVDEDGEIVEAEPPSVKRQRALDRALKVAEETRRAEEERQQAEAMDVDVAENSDSVAEELSDGDDDELSDDASSASGDDDEPSEDEGKVQEAKPSTSTSKSPQAEADVSIPSSNFKTPEPEAAREVHPLEALYKRAPNPAAEDAAKHALPAIDTSFSFFNPGDVEEEDDETTSVPTHPPQTPHTKQDLEWRALRSAAPTPDTAGLGKRFRFAIDGAEQDKEDDSESDGDEEMTDAVPSAASVARESGDGELKDESEFRKWFYEHRGENNRAWKKKRKEAKKQQRQRENRRLTRRVV